MRSFLFTLVVVVAYLSAGTIRAQVNEITKLLASDGALGDAFGVSVAFDGDTAIVGAPMHQSNGSWQHGPGAAYVFVRSDGVWSEQAKFDPDNTQSDNRFGRSVAICGETAVVGAPHEGDEEVGAVYVFTRSGGVWTFEAKLFASDGRTNDWFGDRVAIDADTIIVGTSGDGNENGHLAGAAYVFVRNEGIWSEQAKLIASDSTVRFFGWAVSVDGDTVIVGSRSRGDSVFGTANVFVRTDGTWTEQATLAASDEGENDYFSWAIAQDGDTAVIGACGDDEGEMSSCGSAYVFERRDGEWTERAKLLAHDRERADYFGYSVAIDQSTIVIGAIYDDSVHQSSGSAYVFARDGTAWRQRSKLVASDEAEGAYLGYSVAVQENTAIGGACSISSSAEQVGSVYVFNIACAIDLTSDGVVDSRDFIAYLNAWAAGDTRADWDLNNIIDTRDLVAFLNDWVAGCS